MGGVLYISNIIKMLNWLEDNDKPLIKLIYKKELKKPVEEINYPYLEKIQVSFPNLKKGYISSWINRKNSFIHRFIEGQKIDAVFPLQDYPVSYLKYPGTQLVAWYPDLQHKHYPEFFSKTKLLERDLRLRLLLNNCNHLVLSSKSALRDIQRFYNPKNINLHVYNFTSVIDSFDFSNWDNLRKEKHLPREYFVVSNQFLEHKNHRVVLQALALLQKKGLKPVVAFAGNIIGSLSSKCVSELRLLIEEYKLEKQIVFLEHLSRQEYLTLIRYCKAIIQPSLFEGWSTVIEDAISLQTPVIASNIDVNKEQLGVWAPFFDPKDALSLSKLIEKQPSRSNFDEIIYEPYDQRVKKAAQAFMSVFDN
jgi:glycosyltransferase involved in cell wall biosynthesis